MTVYTFTMQMPSDRVQEAINSNDCELTVTLPWHSTRGFEDASAGDGAVIVVSDPADKSSWIGTITDVEYEPGYPMTVAIKVS
jgi:hypothetical protein